MQCGHKYSVNTDSAIRDGHYILASEYNVFLRIAELLNSRKYFAISLLISTTKVDFFSHKMTWLCGGQRLDYKLLLQMGTKTDFMKSYTSI